jgi:hypothetical protein
LTEAHSCLSHAIVRVPDQLFFSPAASNVLGLGFIFALQYLISEPAFGPPPLLPANVFILGNAHPD